MEERKIRLPGWMRALSVVVGIICLLGGLTTLIFPGLGILFLVTLVSVGLIFIGIERLVIGISGSAYQLVPPGGSEDKSKQPAAQQTAVQ